MVDAFFGDSCDPGPQRKGVAISRLSEVQLLNGEQLQQEDYKKRINKEFSVMNSQCECGREEKGASNRPSPTTATSPSMHTLVNGAKADEPTDAMASSATDQPKKVRSKLKNYDIMPAQVLIPNRESSISNKALSNLAKTMAAGNKSAAFFNELTDPSPEKRS
jgi:hypothetical protein